MKRLFDLMLALIALIFLAIPMFILAILIKFTSNGPVLYWSDRMGRDNKIFSMPKFRSMRIDTPTVATHLLHKPDRYLTPIGKLLRKASLDELPQLWSILKGDMSFVGPRPVLSSQNDLITFRTQCGIHNLLPGLTGWAQINGRDDLSSLHKVLFDLAYLQRKSFGFDLYIIWLTFSRVMTGHGISH